MGWLRYTIKILTLLSIPSAATALTYYLYVYWGALWPRGFRQVPSVPTCEGNATLCCRKLLRPVPNIHKKPVIVIDALACQSMHRDWGTDPVSQYLAMAAIKLGGYAVDNALVYFDCCVPRGSRQQVLILVAIVGDYLLCVGDPGHDRQHGFGHFLRRDHCPLPPKQPLPFTHAMGRIYYQSWPDHYHGHLSPPRTNKAVMMPAWSLQDTRFASIAPAHTKYTNKWFNSHEYYALCEYTPIHTDPTLLDGHGVQVPLVSDFSWLPPLTGKQIELYKEAIPTLHRDLKPQPGMLIPDDHYATRGFPIDTYIPWWKSYQLPLVNFCWRFFPKDWAGPVTSVRPGFRDPLMCTEPFRVLVAHFLLKLSPLDVVAWPRPLVA